jgi:hypothetical protein
MQVYIAADLSAERNQPVDLRVPELCPAPIPTGVTR